MELLQIFILAVIQGIAEFLPISSSGHVVIAAAILTEMFPGQELPDRSDINIWLHAGTLLSIVVVFWRRIWSLLGADRHVISLLIVGTLPAVVVGLAIHLSFRHVLGEPIVAGFLLPATGLVLIWAARQPEGETDYQQLTWRGALLIGGFQAVAILPGISRSGMTIAAGLAIGLRRQSAATFSFLLAIPAISGAVVLDLIRILKDKPDSTGIELLALGAVVSFVVGLFALRWLLRWFEKGRIQYFAYWCIPAGIGVILWQCWANYPVG